MSAPRARTIYLLRAAHAVENAAGFLDAAMQLSGDAYSVAIDGFEDEADQLARNLRALVADLPDSAGAEKGTAA
jgi:hypothetical protein